MLVPFLRRSWLPHSDDLQAASRDLSVTQHAFAGIRADRFPDSHVLGDSDLQGKLNSLLRVANIEDSQS
jgi:hypothetical protein